MSQSSPQPPDLPPHLPPGPPPVPPAASPVGPAYQPLPAHRSQATRPVFWIALVVGLLAIFALLAAGAFSAYNKVIKGVKEKQARQETLTRLEQLQKEHQQDLRKELEETGSIGTQSRGHLEKLQQVLEQSGSGSGEDAATSRATAAWTRKIGGVSQRFAEVSSRLEDPPVLEAASLKSKDDVSSRRALVQEFLTANQEMLDAFRNSERDFRTYLRAEGVPEEKLPAMARGVLTSLRRQQPVIQKIRDLDTAYGGHLLQWLDLIESEWGAWTAENEEVVFSRPEAQETHRQIAANMEKAGAEQAEAQRQLVELQEKEP